MLDCGNELPIPTQLCKWFLAWSMFAYLPILPQLDAGHHETFYKSHREQRKVQQLLFRRIPVSVSYEVPLDIRRSDGSEYVIICGKKDKLQRGLQFLNLVHREYSFCEVFL